MKQLHHPRDLPPYWSDDLKIINREGLTGNVKNDLCLQVQDVVLTAAQGLDRGVGYGVAPSPLLA